MSKPKVARSLTPPTPKSPEQSRAEEAFAQGGRGDTGLVVPGQQPARRRTENEDTDLSLPAHIIPAEWDSPVEMVTGKSTHTPYMFRLTQNQRDRMERVIKLTNYPSKQSFCESAIERALRLAEQELGLL